MSTKAIQNILISLIFATLIVPFVIFTNTYFPYIFGKAIVFRVLILLAVVVWSFLIIKDTKFLPSKNNVLVALGALNGFYLISAFTGVDLRESIFSGFERMDGWTTTFLVFVFFLVVSSVMKEKKTWNNFFIAQIATSLILLFIGVKELFDNGINFRIDATLGNPIYLSVVFLFSIFFAFYLLFENYSKIFKVLLFITIPLNMLGVFFTGTRGSMVGIFISGLLLSIFFVYKYWKIKKVKILSSILLFVIILVPVILFSYKDSDFVRKNGTLTRLTQINFTQGTGSARFMNWGTAINGIKERPMLGWGQNSYTYVYDKYYDPKMSGQEPFFDRAHNIILDTTVQGGLLALISYLLIYVFAFLAIKRNKEIKTEQKIIISGLLIAYFIQNLFVFDNLTSYLLFASVLAFAVYYQKSGVEKINNKYYIPTVVVLFSLVSFVYVVYYPVMANSNLIKGMQVYAKDSEGKTVLIQKNGISENKKFFENSLKGNFTGILEIKSTLLQTAGNLTRIQTNDEKVKKDTNDFLAFSYQEIVKEANRKPDSARAQYFAGAFTTQLGDLKGGEMFMRKALKISPNRQLYLNGLSKILKMLGRNDEYFETVKNIYLLDTNNDDAWLQYSNEIALRDQQAYLNFLVESNGEERISKALKVFDLAIEESPNNPQLYVNKGVFLSKVRKFDESIKIFEDIEIKFPMLKKQIDEWISELKKGQMPK